MSRARATTLVTAGVLLSGLIALLLAGGGDRRSTAFSLDVPPNVPVVRLLADRGQACESPVAVGAASVALRVWAQAQSEPGGTVVVSVRDLSSRQRAAGRFEVSSRSVLTPTATLDRPVAAGQQVSICLHNRGPKPVLLFGSYRNPDSGAAIQNGKRTKLALSMVFSATHPRSLLSLIPTVFHRASLFRFSWMGAWTFWLLVVAVLVALGAAVVAVGRAAADEAASS